MTELVLAAGAVLSVLAFGGVAPLYFAPVQAAVVIAAVAAFWKRGFAAIPARVLWIVVTLLAIAVLQIIPLPPGLLAALSPARAALQDNLAGLPIRLPPTLSVNSYETQAALLRLVCYVLVFLLAYQSTRLRGRAAALAAVLLGLGLFEAVYGIVQYLTGWQYIFFFKKVEHVEEATGTYLNRNHFAGLLEMALPFLMARMLLTGRSGRSGGRPRWRQLVESPFSSRLLRDLVLATVLLLALLYSRSRMGIAAGLAGVLVVAGIALLENPRRRSWASLALILLLVAGFAWWIGLDPVFRRFEALGQPGELEQLRLPIWRDTLALLRDYPLFGTGLGTYTWSSFHYQSHLLNRRYVHAHNDYLEFSADIGIPAALLLFVCLWILAAKVARKTLALERTHQKVAAAGCAGAMAAILIHSITDFNLQIPANAYFFSWIAGTAAALVSVTAEASPSAAPSVVPGASPVVPNDA